MTTGCSTVSYEYGDTMGCGPGDGASCQPSRYSNAASSDVFDIGLFEDQLGSVPSRPASSDNFHQANVRSECEALNSLHAAGTFMCPRNAHALRHGHIIAPYGYLPRSKTVHAS